MFGARPWRAVLCPGVFKKSWHSALPIEIFVALFADVESSIGRTRVCTVQHTISLPGTLSLQRRRSVLPVDEIEDA